MNIYRRYTISYYTIIFICGQGAPMDMKSSGISDSDFYLVFISIVFGVLVAVWIEPLSELLRLNDPIDQQPDIQGLVKIFYMNALKMVRGAIMFLILTCLWWWYARFLGRVAPATRYWSFLYDFVSLCCFAVAFRTWGSTAFFPVIVMISAFLMMIRFQHAKFGHGITEPQKTALKIAIWALYTVLLGAGGALMAVIYMITQHGEKNANTNATSEDWIIVEVVTLIVLTVGILATMLAVCRVEGAPSFFPNVLKQLLNSPKPQDSTKETTLPRVQEQ